MFMPMIYSTIRGFAKRCSQNKTFAHKPKSHRLNLSPATHTGTKKCLCLFNFKRHLAYQLGSHMSFYLVLCGSQVTSNHEIKNRSEPIPKSCRASSIVTSGTSGVIMNPSQVGCATW